MMLSHISETYGHSLVTSLYIMGCYAYTYGTLFLTTPCQEVIPTLLIPEIVMSIGTLQWVTMV